MEFVPHLSVPIPPCVSHPLSTHTHHFLPLPISAHIHNLQSIPLFQLPHIPLVLIHIPPTPSSLTLHPCFLHSSRTSSPGPGPVAPFPWVKRCVESLVPNPSSQRQKILIGLNFYGYEYSTSVQGKINCRWKPLTLVYAASNGENNVSFVLQDV